MLTIKLTLRKEYFKGGSKDCTGSRELGIKNVSVDVPDSIDVKALIIKDDFTCKHDSFEGEGVVSVNAL